MSENHEGEEMTTTGTFACPHCGNTKPHGHEERLEFAARNLTEQVEKLLEHYSLLFKLAASRTGGLMDAEWHAGMANLTRDRIVDVKYALSLLGWSADSEETGER